MADSIRERILSAFAVKLATITVANGYKTDIGSNVHRAVRSTDEANLPWVSILDGAETFERRGGSMLVSMPVDVHVLYSTPTPSTAVWQVLADVYKCVESWDFKTAGLLDSVEYVEGAPQYPEDGSDVVEIVSRFVFRFDLVRGDPYSQP